MIFEKHFFRKKEYTFLVDFSANAYVVLWKVRIWISAIQVNYKFTKYYTFYFIFGLKPVGYGTMVFVSLDCVQRFCFNIPKVLILQKIAVMSWSQTIGRNFSIKTSISAEKIWRPLFARRSFISEKQVFYKYFRRNHVFIFFCSSTLKSPFRENS